LSDAGIAGAPVAASWGARFESLDAAHGDGVRPDVAGRGVGN